MQAKFGEYVMVSGLLPRDAEFSYAGSKGTPLCKFSAKVDERGVEGEKIAVWVNCTCWRDVAQTASVFVKGDVVLAVGKISERQYTGRDGEEKTSRELVCEFVIRMPRSASSAHQAASAPQKSAETFEPLEVSDGDLPF